jgi:hypothetical protein
MTRAEHLAWAKARALAYCDTNPVEAFASFASDLSKHPETAGHSALEVGAMLRLGGQLKTPEAMRQFIEGTR